MRLCSYKMGFDTGFAPNPFRCSLSLATCKPDIRLTAREADWVAGFTSKSLAGHEVGSERLVYLMRVGQKLLIRDYFSDPRFRDKIPDRSARGKTGDNIYRPLRSDAKGVEDFELLPNANHFDRDRDRDLRGEFVLISDEFYYFGGRALALPVDVRPMVPRGQSRYGRRTGSERAERFVRYVRANYRPGRHGQPHQWPRACGETSPQCG